MAYFKFDNKKIYYRIKGKGEPLLLLHGNTVSSRMFSALINKNDRLDIHLFEKGNHPAMISNKNEFFEIIKKRIIAD